MKETASKSLLIERRDASLVLTLNRPGKRNALSPEIYDGLLNGLELAQAEDSIANIVIQGAEGFFCAGGDLNALAERAALPRDKREQRIQALHDVVRAVRTCRKPVIAAIEGGAAGAGASLALAADMIVAATDAYFRMAYVKVGLVPDGGATASLLRALPPQKVAEIFLLGEPISALRLAQFGIVNRIAATGGALGLALKLGEELAAGALGAQSEILAMLDSAADLAFDDQMDREKQLMASALGGAEAAEGIAAFMKRRKPEFDGLATTASNCSG